MRLAINEQCSPRCSHGMILSKTRTVHQIYNLHHIEGPLTDSIKTLFFLSQDHNSRLALKTYDGLNLYISSVKSYSLSCFHFFEGY